MKLTTVDNDRTDAGSESPFEGLLAQLSDLIDKKLVPIIDDVRDLRWYVGNLSADVGNLRADFGRLERKVDNLDSNFSRLERKVDKLDSKF
jgi:hypothetical protein